MKQPFKQLIFLVAAICPGLSSCSAPDQSIDQDSKFLNNNSGPERDHPSKAAYKFELIGDKDRRFDPQDFDELTSGSVAVDEAYSFNRELNLSKVRRWIGHSVCEGCDTRKNFSQKFKIESPTKYQTYRLYVSASYLKGQPNYRVKELTNNFAVTMGSTKIFAQQGWFKRGEVWAIEVEALDTNPLEFALTNDSLEGANYLYIDYYEFLPTYEAPVSIQGFGSKSIGGDPQNICFVTSLIDHGPGSLRSCVESGGSKTVKFKVSGEIYLESEIGVPAHTTIDGAGANIRITGSTEIDEENEKYPGHLLKIDGWRNGAHNIIVRNLSLVRGTTDYATTKCNRCGVNMLISRGAEQIVIDKNSFRYCMNKCLALSQASSEITISYNLFRDSYFAVLIGASDSIERPESEDDDLIRATLHHNLFDRIKRRTPRVNRSKNTHLFNNAHIDWGEIPDADYAVGATTGAEVYIESDIFKARDENPEASIYDWPGTNISEGKIQADSCLLLNGANVRTNTNNFSFNPRNFYSYDVQAANDSLLDELRGSTGPH